MKHPKKRLPPRIEDELTNRGVVALDEELSRLGRFINYNIATEVIDGGTFTTESAEDFLDVIRKSFIVDGGSFSITPKITIDGGSFRWK